MSVMDRKARLSSVVLLAALLGGTVSCSNDGSSSAPNHVASPVVTAPAVANPVHPSAERSALRTCRLAQLTPLPYRPGRGVTYGDSVMGTWMIPFSVVNRGRTCTLRSHDLKLFSSTRDAHTHSVASLDLTDRPGQKIELNTGDFVVLHSTFSTVSRPCQAKEGARRPLYLQARVRTPGRADKFVLQRVPHVGVPRGVLACGTTRFMALAPAKAAPPTLIARSDRSRSRRRGWLQRIPSGAGVDATMKNDPAGPPWDGVGLNRGVPLPLFCPVRPRSYSEGLVARLAVVAGFRTVRETRQLDLRRNGVRAHAAYQQLLDWVRACPQDGSFGQVTRLSSAPLGSESFVIVDLEAGTVAGPSTAWWTIVRVGNAVLIAQRQTFLGDGPTLRRSIERETTRLAMDVRNLQRFEKR